MADCLDVRLANERTEAKKMLFSGIECDICGATIGYNGIVGKKYLILFAREKGWTIGKYHKCPQCNKKSKDGGEENADKSMA